MRSLPALALLLLTPSALASILAIDYGAEWTKVSLVKPGLPFDVVLNRDSKRKVQSVVGWKNGDERLFGGEAAAVAGRFPYDSFPFLKPHLGSLHPPATSPAFPHHLAPPTSRATLSFARTSPKGDQWTVEELVGMQFAYARALAEELAGEKVLDAVVAVPGWFGQAERQAVVDALEIGGMRTVGLINDGPAVAMNYAMTRTFPEKEYHLFYDSGSLSTSATLVSLHTYPVSPPVLSTSKKPSSVFKPKPVNTTHIEVLGLGYDRSLGGALLDSLLRAHIRAQFEAEHGEIKGGEREKALAKIAKEATRVKAVLSANSESAITIESLFDDRDFRSRITRETSEALAAPDLPPARIAQPILDALAFSSAHNLTLGDVKSVVLFGGNSRVPLVLAAVKDAVGEGKIAQNVNTDEAAVLGAAFYGATQSRQFKTKAMRVLDLQPYDVQAAYLAEPKNPSDQPRTINTVLFPAGSRTGVKKTLKLKRSGDFDLTFSYRAQPDQSLPFPKEIMTAKITGLASALANLTEAERVLNPDPVVRVAVQVSDMGTVQVVDASIVLETVVAPKAEGGLGSKLKGLFGGGGGGADKKDGEPVVAEDAAASEGAVKKTAGGAEAKKADEEEVKGERVVQLKVVLEPGAVPPMTSAEKFASRSRLQLIDALESARRAREEALNVLEGYLYRLRNMLSSDPTGSIFHEYSTEAERGTLEQGVEDGMVWLGEHGGAAETGELKKRLDALQAVEQPIQFRNLEAQRRKTSIDQFQQALYAGRAFLQSAKQNETEDVAAGLEPKYTQAELNTVTLTMAGLEEWFGRLMDAQRPLALNADPILLTEEVDRKGRDFQDEVLKLLQRKPVKPKKAKKDSKKEKKAAEGEGEGKEGAEKESEEKTGPDEEEEEVASSRKEERQEQEQEQAPPPDEQQEQQEGQQPQQEHVRDEL